MRILIIIVYILATGSQVAALTCSDSFSNIERQTPVESGKFCFFSQCSSVMFVSKLLDIDALNVQEGRGISIKLASKENGEQLVEGIILKQDYDSMTILTESGIRTITNSKINISHIVLFNTNIHPEKRIPLVYSNFLIRLDLLTAENPNDFIQFNIRLKRDDINMVAKISKTKDGFLFKSIDGKIYEMKRSLIESAYERGGDYQIMSGLQNTPM